MAQLSDKRLNQLKESIPKIVGLRIKELRNERGLTQTELAELVGKDRQYLYKIEKGRVTPNVVTISALVYALEISLTDFFDFKI
ncbi:helix-turn-helix transcriptional regulator [Pontimicrobium aquaticum]|uniref:Helix-turn-helix transcriptional regulator n=1 Tax=Pontimicrobium aquaticum TaxID=2565367 RepID=A0A4U0F0M3_9FLAO|nr:helix-turn-helix transcriptional regulator [Pontimicrobium aquaticum]TJY37937.1 helix-turn-helix transcriptional regulator [Pontimicrobium aquaticum]